MIAPPLGAILEELEVLELYGDNAAHAVRRTIERVGDAWIEWWNDPLTVREAHEWGGYSISQLNRQIDEGTIQAVADRKIRRRHVPVKPGHEPPLGLEPTSGTDDWLTNIKKNRRLKRAS